METKNHRSYEEYVSQMKDTEISEKFEYSPDGFWLDDFSPPLKLESLGRYESAVIKIPPRIESGYGTVVPVIALSNKAFSGNGNITDIMLPSSIERISERAFSGCSGLRNITIPKKVRIIKEGTFDGCSSLENIYYEGTMEEWKAINIVHEKHEIEFGSLRGGSPVEELKAERLIHIPGNDVLFTANIHFHCNLDMLINKSCCTKEMNCRDLTHEKWNATDRKMMI